MNRIFEILAISIVIGIFMAFGAYGVYVTAGLLFIWQFIYRLKYGYWMRGVDH